MIIFDIKRYAINDGPGIRLVILVNIVQGQAYKLAIHNCLRVIEGVAVGADCSHEVCTALLNTIIQFTDATYEGVTIRLAIATSEEGDGLVIEIGSLQHAQTVVPVILQLTSTPGRSTENQVLVVLDHFGSQVLHVDGLAAKFLSYLFCDSLARSCRGTVNYNC